MEAEHSIYCGLKSLLDIEKAQAIGFCVAILQRELPRYYSSMVEQAIDEMCAKCGVTKEERDLRSLPADPAKAKVAIGALETLFRGGFAWDEQTFRGTILDHPILKDLAASLVWGELAVDGSAHSLFRIDDMPVRVKFLIVIVHPAQVDATEVERWKRLGLSAPFAQLDVPCIRPSEAKLPSNSISSSALLVRLESRGWVRGRVEKGCLREHVKTFPYLRTSAHVRYTGIPVSYGGEWCPQRFEGIRFVPEAVSPLVMSTVYSDLAFAAAQGQEKRLVAG